MRSSDSFANKVVLVTGATSGIGAATAAAFRGAGAQVIGTGRDQRRLGDLKLDLALSMDVTDPAEVHISMQAIADRFGRLDVIVNNAGIGLFRAWEDTDVDAVERVMAVNLYGAIRVARAALPMLLATKGVLVQVASVAGRRGYAKHTAYCASKHALIGWSESLRCDLAGTGVQVTVVCPPAVRTPFFENAGYMTFDADHPGLVPMTADQVADGILDAAARRVDTVILSRRAKVLDALNTLSPKLLRVVQRFK